MRKPCFRVGICTTRVAADELCTVRNIPRSLVDKICDCCPEYMNVDKALAQMRVYLKDYDYKDSSFNKLMSAVNTFLYVSEKDKEEDYDD